MALPAPPPAGTNAGSGRPSAAADELLLQRSAVAAEHDAGGRQDQSCDAPRESRASRAGRRRPADPCRLGGVRLDLPLELLMQRRVVAGALLVEDDQVRAEAAHSPVGVRQQHLAHQRQVARVGDVTTSIGRSPEIPYAHRPSCPSRLRDQPVGRRPQPRIGIDQLAGEFLEPVRRAGADAAESGTPAGARPRHFEGARHGSRRRYLATSASSASRDGRGHRQEREFLPLARVERDAAAQAEDRIEDRAGRSAETRRSAAGILGRIAAAQKLRAVGFILNAVGVVAGDEPECARSRWAARPATAGRRCAIRTPGSGHSVSMNIFANAGCALSAACGASASST